MQLIVIFDNAIDAKPAKAESKQLQHIEIKLKLRYILQYVISSLD